MKKNLILFLIAFFIYFVIDVGYNILIGLQIDSFYIEQAGISNIYSEQVQRPALILLFFVLIALGNLVLVILPAIEKKNVLQAFLNGFLLGIVAYMTFAFPLAWIIKDYPIMLVPIHTIVGGLLSFFTSGITTWLYLKYNKN